jgi:hypothetical protein
MDDLLSIAEDDTSPHFPDIVTAGHWKARRHTARKTDAESWSRADGQCCLTIEATRSSSLARTVTSLRVT